MHEAPPIHVRRFAELSAPEVWGILQLRSSIFVLEQDCVYLDPDAGDHADGTLHAWIGDDPLYPDSYARLLPLGWADPRLSADTRIIGRVVTAQNARGAGHSGAIIRRLVGEAAREGVGTSLNGQAHLEAWYAGLGFVRCGDDFLEDDIPHVPMARAFSDVSG